MLAVWLVGAIITYFMLPYIWFMETMGFVAVFTEAMLGRESCTFFLNFLSNTIHDIGGNLWI